MTEQEKREKVIKALECCTKKVCIYKDTEKKCPYWELCGEYESSFEDCTTALAKDALALLKAQEPVEPTTKNGAYFCGNPHCRKIIAQMVPCGAPTHRVKYCGECGRAVKWK